MLEMLLAFCNQNERPFRFVITYVVITLSTVNLEIKPKAPIYSRSIFLQLANGVMIDLVNKLSCQC